MILAYRRIARQVENWDRLHDELGSEELSIRRRAVEVLVQLDHEAIPFLAELIDDSDYHILSMAVYRLAEIGRPGCQMR